MDYKTVNLHILNRIPLRHYSTSLFEICLFSSKDTQIITLGLRYYLNKNQYFINAYIVVIYILEKKKTIFEKASELELNEMNHFYPWL